MSGRTGRLSATEVVPPHNTTARRSARSRAHEVASHRPRAAPHHRKHGLSGQRQTGINTGMAERMGIPYESLVERWTALQLTQGSITPEDVAAAVVWLASEATGRHNPRPCCGPIAGHHRRSRAGVRRLLLAVR